MPKVTFGNHVAVFVPRQDRDKVRKFYRDGLSAALLFKRLCKDGSPEAKEE
jgi:hypothetical protein